MIVLQWSASIMSANYQYDTGVGAGWALAPPKPFYHRWLSKQIKKMEQPAAKKPRQATLLSFFNRSTQSTDCGVLLKKVKLP